MPKIACPYCSYTRFWQLRREAKKCKRCKREFRSVHYPVPTISSTECDWKEVLHVFLRMRTIQAVVRETSIGHCRVEQMLQYLRLEMFHDKPEPFIGVCEADETFIGGQWKNKPRSVRRKGTPKGHGTTKTPIVGVYSRKTGQVATKVLSKRNEETVIGFMVSQLNHKRAILYTDGYKMNRAVAKHGIRHYWVNHHLGEFGRGAIHTNSIEGFWGYLKRHLAQIGGIQHRHLHFFVAEFQWRFNYRNLSLEEQQQALLKLIKKE